MNEKVLRHKEICDGLNELYARKNHDYGDNEEDRRKHTKRSLSFHLTYPPQQYRTACHKRT